MIQLNGTSATKMRDKLISERSDGNITPKEIESKLGKIEIPQWVREQIIEMVNYRVYDRCTCSI